MFCIYPLFVEPLKQMESLIGMNELIGITRKPKKELPHFLVIK
jgi:hypothetical protein